MNFENRKKSRILTNFKIANEFLEMGIEPNSNRTRTYILAEPNRTRTDMQKNM